MSSVGWIPADFGAPATVRAGVTTRVGGVSGGAYAGFNLASHVGDVPEQVQENRARLREGLQLPSEPIWLQQVHGTGVFVDEVGVTPAAPYDAAVTFYPDRVLAVLTADCLPVVLVSSDGQRLGVAHAGWRGLQAGVLEATVAALGTDPGRILAWLGPAIGQDAFEVGDDVRSAFVDVEPLDADAFVANARGRWQADLVLLACRRLARCGVHRVTANRSCTYTDANRFYSHRRDPGSGRMATLVWRGG